MTGRGCGGVALLKEEAGRPISGADPMNKIVTALKQPTTWLLIGVTLLAATAYSTLRKPFASIATKLPGADA